MYTYLIRIDVYIKISYDSILYRREKDEKATAYEYILNDVILSIMHTIKRSMLSLAYKALLLIVVNADKINT